MRRFKLNKLVRDEVFANIVKLDQTPDYLVLNDQDFLSALKAKLLEEAQEFDPTCPDAIDELTDLLEVIEWLGKLMNQNFTQLRAHQRTRRKKRGGFHQRIFIQTLTMKNSDPWAKYYASDPRRFPELPLDSSS